jgi:hypothetical protein
VVIAYDVIGYILLIYVLAWALALAYIVFLTLVLVLSRGHSGTARDIFRRAVAAAAPQGSVHAVSRVSPPDRLAARIRELQVQDPGFDLTAFLDGTRVAVGAFAMAWSAENDRLLRRITTPGYWQTPNGKAVAAVVTGWKNYAGARPGTANRGRLLLDVSWRQPEVTNVSLGEQGTDRITVRLSSVITGAAQPGWHPVTEATRLDWEFVRPACQHTDPAAVLLPRSCPTCGGPYHSDLDDACPYCRTPRPDTQAGWRLDRLRLTVDAQSRLTRQHAAGEAGPPDLEAQ